MALPGYLTLFIYILMFYLHVFELCFTRYSSQFAMGEGDDDEKGGFRNYR